MTLPNIPQVPPDDVVEELRKRLEAQPWYRRFSNAVTSGFGLLALVVWIAAANGIDLPGGVQTGISSAIAVATLLGVLKTKNGVTPRGIDDVQAAAEYVGRHHRTE